MSQGVWALVLGAAIYSVGCGGTTPQPRVEKNSRSGQTSVSAPVNSERPTKQQPPLTRKEDIREVLFGATIKDPYRWLEDDESAEVQTWMQQQDAVARDYLSSLPLRDQLHQRLKELLYVERRSAPQHKQGRYFFVVKPADQEKSIHYWKQGKDGEPRVLLDPNTMSDDGSISIGGVFPTDDGKLVAYLEKENNADDSTLKVMDVDTGQLHSQDQIEGLRYTGPSWTPDGAGFYYTWRPTDPNIPEAERTAFAEVRFHRLGTDPAKDELIHPALGDASKFLSGGLSYDGKYLFIVKGHGWSKSEVFVRLAAERQAPFRAMTEGLDARYSVSTYRDRFFILTNEDAPRYRLFETTFDKLERKHWRELVAEDEDAVLDSVAVVGRRLVLRYERNAYTELQVRELDGKPVRQVKLPAIGTASSLFGHEEEDEAYYEFSSFTYPSEIYEVSMQSGAQKLYDRVQVPAKPEDFVVKQEWFSSKDGTRVPMFIIHKRGLKLEGSNPTLLYGYGGFNVSLLPSFSSSLFPWLEHGGVYAMPNIRGGGEFGEDWHRAGMLGNKQNVFDDFIAAAEHLIAAGYTDRRHLGIAGRSNGGLLVGAVMTQRPELFRAVLCGVPLLDMLRYHEFGLGKAWIPEYGDPQKEEHFRFLHAYSPYHRLREGVRYPALLMLSADTDDRVHPMHARKFVAAVQAVSSNDPAAYLRIETNAGHGGADMRSKFIERAADEYAFLLDQLQ